MGEMVVLDSSNLPAIIADATGEPLEAPAKPAEVAKPPDAPPVEAKPVEAVKLSEEAYEGLTEDEKKTYTEKMKKSVAWRHGKMKEAQETAARERQGRLAAEERAAAAERERDAAKTPEVKGDPKEPKPENFPNQQAYLDAMIDFKVDQRLAKERETARQAAEQAERERIVETARERVAHAIELVPDYEEVTSEVSTSVPMHIAGAMMESELFPELGYHFAKHPEELERLSKLPVTSALVALGKIESTLTSFAAPAKEKANGASKPSTDTDGGTSANPSRPRASVPVIQPLNARGAPEVETPESSPTKEIQALERRRGVSLTKRARH